MQGRGLSSDRYPFGAFVLDVRTGELRKGPTRLRVPDQSIEVLKALLERPGELVTREELRQRLWADDTFVDFEQGLNGVVRRLRDALGDSADAPKYIETLPRRGYRFVGVLESPDGQRIAFLRQRPNTRGSTIIVIPVLGGAEQPVIETRSPPGSPTTGGLSWTPDSKGVVYLDELEGGTRSAVFVCWIDTGKREQLTTPPADFTDSSPVIAPDGSQLAFVRRFFGFTNGRVLVQPLQNLRAAGDPRTVIDDGAATVEWTRDGRSVIFGKHGGLWRVRADGGSPQLVYAGAGLIAPSVARQAQRLVFQHLTTDENIWRIEGPSSVNWPSIAPPTEIIKSTYADRSPNISFDGRKVTFRSIRSGINEIWASNIDGSDPMRLTHSDGRFVGSPRWSLNGSWVAFDSSMPGAFDIYVVSAHGGEMTAVTHGPGNNFRPSWSPDGQWIYFASTRSGTEQIWKVRSDGSGDAIPLTKNGGFEPIASFDSKYVYYAKSLTGTGIWRVSVDGGGEVKILDRGIAGAWGLTEQRIVLIDRLARPQVAIEVYSYDAIRLSRALLPAGLRIDGADPAFSVARDGSWIVYTQLDSWGSDIEMIDGFR